MKIENPSNYKFLRFEKSRTNGKKYDAILLNKTTKKEKRVPFGALGYSHYKDKALGLYSKSNHLDAGRRARYRSRHKGENLAKFSSGYFAWKYLW
ncbi:hypothetical protein EBT25_01785 [bacterium]|jgi:hypothetical protein|nr:hypothetical protein [bacterium]